MKISEVNELSHEDFIDTFKNVVEKYPQFAETLYYRKPFTSLEHLLSEMDDIITKYSLAEKERILSQHPPLGKKIVEITKESIEEQNSAGINDLTKTMKDKLNTLNKEYDKKFCFPFVICVRENDPNIILTELEKRLNNKRIEEIKIGINEVKKICKLRIKDIID